jgi:hypothetical protein
MHIFILYLFDIMDIDIFSLILNQSLQILTLTKFRTHTNINKNGGSSKNHRCWRSRRSHRSIHADENCDPLLTVAPPPPLFSPSPATTTARPRPCINPGNTGERLESRPWRRHPSTSTSTAVESVASSSTLCSACAPLLLRNPTGCGASAASPSTIWNSGLLSHVRTCALELAPDWRCGRCSQMNAAGSPRYEYRCVPPSVVTCLFHLS